jgi:hypothetical protein
MWDGSFWVLTRNGYQVNELPPLAARRQAAKFAPERPGYRLGRVVLAAAVGLTLSFIPIPAPSPGSLDSALTELAVVTLLRVVFTFVAVVVILSLGRQGIDVLLLRAMLTTFLMGAAFMGFIFGAVFLATFPFPFTPRIPLPLVVVLGGLIFAVSLGPVVAVASALANLLWYRSLLSLTAQLGIFSRLVLALALATNIAFSIWASVSGHNFGSLVLGGGPPVALLVMLFLSRKGVAGTAAPAA